MADRDYDPKDGNFTQVMNEFIDKLIEYGLDSNEWRVLMLVMRKTWGIKGRAWAELKWETFLKRTKLGKSSLTYAMRKLKARNILHTDKKGYKISYKINSKVSTWKNLDEIEGFRPRKKASPKTPEKSDATLKVADATPKVASVLPHPSEVNKLPHPGEVIYLTQVNHLPHPGEVVPIKDNIKDNIKDTPHNPPNGNNGSSDKNPACDPNPKIMTKKERIEHEARLVIDYMNSLAGKGFQYKDHSLSKIRGRLSDGFTVEQCFQVVKNKWEDPDFKAKYFRPITLFRPSLFESYLNENGTKKKLTKRQAKMAATVELFQRRYYERRQNSGNQNGCD